MKPSGSRWHATAHTLIVLLSLITLLVLLPPQQLSALATTTTPLILQDLEPNDSFAQANSIIFGASATSSVAGILNQAFDTDTYSITVLPGTTVALTLTNLPADYDLALIDDPSRTLTISDGLDLDNISSFPHTKKSFSDSGIALNGKTIAASVRDGIQDETIQAFLATGGTYYLVVNSGTGAADASRPYRLDLSVKASALVQPSLRARPTAALQSQFASNATVLFVVNETRMRQRFPSDSAATTQLSALFGLTGLATTGLNAAVLNLSLASSTPGDLNPTDQSHLDQLYAQWDAQPGQPLLANEVAQQIWYAIDRAIKDRYTAITSIVLVGGDEIVPFYRIPDEAPLATEQDYFNALNASSAVLDRNTALGGSLFFGFIKTDNFYADRQPTPWRGRALYLPDLGIGRLVEQPSEILTYLNAQNFNNPSILANAANAGALVTGYDFASDQAEAIATAFESVGFLPNGTLTNSPTVNRLISDSWSDSELTNLWFSGQLNRLHTNYANLTTRYQLMSLNGHFSHYLLEPALRSSPSFPATRLLTPTVLAGRVPYFATSNRTGSLIYSVGCQAGLNVDDSLFAAGSPVAADWPQAVLKQGGNWLGNTGFGYGDTDVIGYSERLMLLFTQEIGRKRRVGGSYLGVPIGEALARVKREYVQTVGPEGFSTLDEKVISTMTLYGLPMLRVQVPDPKDPPPAVPVPTRPSASLAVFTRLITFTNSFTSASLSRGSVVRTTGLVEDSFRPSVITPVTSTDQLTPGQAVLPLLSYDLTLSPTVQNGSLPEVRGVRLLSAETLPDLSDFRPKITNIVTDDTYLPQITGTEASQRNAWLPVVPYTFQRITDPAAALSLNDRLLVTPAQVQMLSGKSGQLRRYSRLVFEVSYIDRGSASTSLTADNDPPLLISPIVSLPNTPGVPAGKLQVSVVVTDTQSGVKNVLATISSDGQTWVPLPLVAASGGRYQALVDQPASDRTLSVIFSALDQAGNVATSTAKGSFAVYKQQHVSLVLRLLSSTYQEAPAPPTAIPTAPLPNVPTATPTVIATATPASDPFATDVVPHP